MLKLGAVRCTLLICLCAPLWAGASELYRYTNDKGVIVLDRQGVPTQYIGQGYEVLNDQGRVVRVVPPAPSPEEMQRLLAEKARAKTDAQLLRLYSRVEDIELAKERKLSELDGMIGVARGNLQSLGTQQTNLEKQAAEHERAGRAVPQHLLTQIDNLKSEQASVAQTILRYQQGRAQAETGFDADRARLA
ncbi:MAG TPA: DUF4124 domain-containing protein, partial [Pseudomonas sp.]|nr:DUF4124 domain-containing protein [Pseudomonas sp.]